MESNEKVERLMNMRAEALKGGGEARIEKQNSKHDRERE